MTAATHSETDRICDAISAEMPKLVSGIHDLGAELSVKVVDYPAPPDTTALLRQRRAKLLYLFSEALISSRAGFSQSSTVSGRLWTISSMVSPRSIIEVRLSSRLWNSGA